MIALRPLRRSDVTMLDERLKGDPSGTARFGMPPEQWWRLVEGDANRHGWIILDEDRPVGYFDAEQDDGTVYIAALIFARDRASGLGRTVLRAALATPPLTEARNVIGCVEVDNSPARRLLSRADFVEDGFDDDGLMIYRYAIHSPPERA